MPSKTLTALIAAVFSGAVGVSAHTNQTGLDPLNFDDSTSACVDFFQHADGGWLASNPIPAEYSQWSLDDELRERNLALLRGVLEDAAKAPGEHGGTTQKIEIGNSAAIIVRIASILVESMAVPAYWKPQIRRMTA